ncbi:Holliday junction resolvase RuvX [Desertibaculum subflavum]|uniref:Holliday junction resolvase RuvX n=1 Tax=Desertibaculum subflavum TaxID=2268458 RepID=UPI000E675611
MIISNIAELGPLLPPLGRLVGLDVGAKTIGVAISDAGRRVATPRETIRRGKFATDAAKIAHLVAADRVAAVILGLPVNMDGTEGPRCQSVRQFARNLDPHLGTVLIAFWDERLSTSAVERMLIEADTSRKRRGEVVDKLAAGWILQGALDYLARLAAQGA